MKEGALHWHLTIDTRIRLITRCQCLYNTWNEQERLLYLWLLSAPFKHESQNLWPQTETCTARRTGKWHIRQSRFSLTAGTKKASKPGMLDSSSEPNMPIRWPKLGWCSQLKPETPFAMQVIVFKINYSRNASPGMLRRTIRTRDESLRHLYYKCVETFDHFRLELVAQSFLYWVHLKRRKKKA